MSLINIKDSNGNWRPVKIVAGRSAYQIAVDNGFEGTELEWLESLKADSILVSDASKLPILDTNNVFNSTNVEDVLIEIYNMINSVMEESY